MDITINNKKEHITYYNTDTVNIYDENDVIRLTAENDINDVISIIARLITINKDLNKSDINALEILLITENIDVKTFKHYYCNKYKVSESTASRSLANLINKYIVYITKEDIIKVNNKYNIEDKNKINNKVIIIEVVTNEEIKGCLP